MVSARPVRRRSGCYSQLFELARLKAVEFDRPVFNWRVRRLVNSGLLRKQVVPYLGTDAMYSITRSGIHGLEEMGITYLGGYVEREMGDGIYTPRRGSPLCSRRYCGYWRECEREYGGRIPG